MLSFPPSLFKWPHDWGFSPVYSLSCFLSMSVQEHFRMLKSRLTLGYEGVGMFLVSSEQSSRIVTCNL